MKKSGRQATTVNILVTPLFQDQNDIVCAIDAADAASQPYVAGGVINLQPSGDYDLNFQLEDGAVPGLQFDTTGPFSCNPNNCPAPGSSNPHFPNPHVPNGYNNRRASVTAGPQSDGRRSSYYYSLNFAGGGRCDPIIINS